MNLQFQNLNKFFDEIKSIGLFQRIFGWKKIQQLSYDAYQEFVQLQNELLIVSKNISDANHSIDLLKKDREQLVIIQNKFSETEELLNKKNDEVSKLNSRISSYNTSIENLEKQLKEKIEEHKELSRKFDELNTKFSSVNKENIQFKQTEESRKKEYDKNVEGVNAIRQHLENEMQKLKEVREKEITDRFERMKQTWNLHEQTVESSIREICRRHTIEYLDKENVPFKGKPDNTIKIAGEYIIFDAKSPASDDLQNFPKYIKDQSESVKKYIKEENVKKNIFLVVPSNTVHVIKQFTYNLADYDVFVVTIDTLEPIILCLKKIEDYEFAEQLSPDERENICRILGKFAHLSKRRVQIDFYFSQEFFSILNKCKSDLPSEILKSVIEFEKSEKLNPPMEKRAKQILLSELENESQKNKKEAEAKGIIFPEELSSIKNIPLSSKND
jgi:hypothetical protein